MREKAAVLMSGGVDSSIAAYLLKKKGYETAGFTYIIYKPSCERENIKRCCSDADIQDARLVCRKLNIPHYVYDLQKEFKECVVNPFFQSYLKGATPNPCFECNIKIKFDILIAKLLKTGFDFIATGHYASVKNGFLYKGKDRTKDQSYFLSGVKKENLKHILFPLSRKTKKEVRELARKINLPVKDKTESQEICFIENDYRTSFKKTKGKIILYSSGEEIGEHNGFFNYTVGQRKGLGVGYKHPLFVVKTDPKENIVYADEKKYCYSNELKAELTEIYEPLKNKTYGVKIRYNAPDYKAKVFLKDKDITVKFKTPVFSPTPGQILCVYDKNKVTMSGVITKTGN